MVDQRTIADDEVARILTVQESHFLDVKRAEISPAKLSESISAFGNADGGELFIGIAEEADHITRAWSGYATMETANGLFQVIDRMTPLRNHYSGTWLNSPGHRGFVLHLIIPKTKDIVLSTDGTAFRRHNAQNIRVVGDEEMRRLRLDKGIVSFEDDTVNVPITTITNSITTVEFMLNVIPSSEPEDWMKKQNLESDGRPIVAAVLLYGDEPQAALPKRSAIKIYRYQTRNEEGGREHLMFDPITIEGPIYNLIADAVSKTKELIEEIKILTEEGLSKVSYPHDTLHEILTNAVLHRDYSVASDIHVRIFENRIEIESPGKFGGHITRSNMLKEQFARNPRIIRLINKFPNPPNKDIGEGLNTAFRAMKQLKLKEPEIEEGENSITVHIRHTPLASPQDAVMQYLEDHAEITNRIARELTGISSENAVKAVFLSLQKTKMLEKVPGKQGNASAWQKYTGAEEASAAVQKRRGRPRQDKEEPS